MSDSLDLTKRTSCRIWILLFLCLDVCACVGYNKCRRLEVESPNPPLVAYQRSATINVTVYYCQYYHEILCKGKDGNNSDCLVEILKYTHVEKLTHGYSDITRNCINAFKSYIFKDKYGYLHNIHLRNYTSVMYTYNNNTFSRTVTISLKTYNTEVDVGLDRMQLRSGTICRYTSGFCHDETENIDVVWEVEDTPDEFSLYRKIKFSDLYYFTIGAKRYAILEWNSKYFPLELTDKWKSYRVANVWKTRQENLIVAEGTVALAKNNPFDPVDLALFFENKQDMYNFLTETCVADLRNTSGSTPFSRYEAILESSRIAHQINDLNKGQEFFLFELQISFYLSVFSALCFVTVMVYITCCTCQNKSCICHCKVSDSCTPKHEGANYSNPYESVK